MENTVDVWQIYLDKILVGYARVVVEASLPVDCKKKCISSRRLYNGIVCLSGMFFYYVWKQAFRNALTVASLKDIVRFEPGLKVHTRSIVTMVGRVQRFLMACYGTR